MPEHKLLKEIVAWLQDIALCCSLVKPALLSIAESLLFMVGLLTMVAWLLLRAH